MWNWPALARINQDVSYAFRTARRNPMFAAVAVITLALGIGVNTAMFSVINTVLLRKPPYTDPERLVTVRQKFPQIGEALLGASPAEYIDYRDRNRAFSSIAGYEDAVFDLTGGTEPIRIRAERVTHTLFSTLGVVPLAGRVFAADEDQQGAPRVAMLSYDFWQQRFGGSLEIVGTVVRLDEQPHTVIGIMPSGFEFPFSPASVGEPPVLWVPMAFTAAQIRDRAAEFPVHIVARLRPDVSLAQAQQDVVRIANEFQRERSDIYTGNLRLEVDVEPLGENAAARARPLLLTLAGAVVVVLLIACANVTNLLLARAAIRQREMAVRNALGASMTRLITQNLTESLLLTMSGAALGCVLAQIIISVVSLWPSFVAGLADVQIDVQVLAFTLIVSLVTAVMCGIAPSLGSMRADITSALKHASRQGNVQGRQRLRATLVVLEASSAVVLLIVAGLLVHSLIAVLRVPMGFSADGVLIARATFNRQRYPLGEGRREAERRIIERLQALPSVTAVGLTTHIPLADERQIGFILEGEDIRSVRWADNALVSGEYFGALGIPLVRGRTFSPDDTPEAPLSAIVNDSMARRYWPNGDALGQGIQWGARKLTIVGVAGDVHVGGIDSQINPTIYTSVFQIESGATTNAVFVVRTGGADVAALAPGVRDAVWSVDHGVPVFDMRTMYEIVARSLEARRFAVTMLSSFAILALALAVIGLYGVLAYAVTQRTSELGVRFAMGATPSQVLQLVVSHGLRLTITGIVIGVCAGLAAARAMAHLLYGVSVYDPATYFGAASLLLLIAAIASYLPARRASRVDPVSALRSE